MTTTIYYFGSKEKTLTTLGSDIAALNELSFRDLAAGMGAFLMGPIAIGIAGGFLGKKLYNMYNRNQQEQARKRAAELIQFIKKTNAKFVAETLDDTKKYRFEPGHLVQDGSFYITDLIYPDVLIPLAEYQERLYKEKMITLKRLLGALGAKSVKVTNISYTKSEYDAGAKFPVQQLAGNVGVEVSMTQDGRETRSHTRTFGLPSFQPFVPSEIQNWVEYNQDFRAFCDSRLESNALTDLVNIEISENTSVGSKIAVKAANVDVEGSFGFKRQCSSTWTFKVEFYSKQELEHLPLYSS